MSYPQHEFEGYKYEPYEDVEYDGDGCPENVKIFHDVKAPNGKIISFDWSPYSVPSLDEFKMWVMLGRPDRFALRQAGGPLDAKDLETLTKRFFKNHFPQ